jgi:hypothetical protein
MRLNLAKKTVIPFDNRNGFATGIALANVDSKPNSPILTFRDGEGKQILSTTIALGTGEHVAFSLADKYPSLALGVGTLEINSDGVTALGLRFNPTGSFTSIQLMEKLRKIQADERLFRFGCRCGRWQSQDTSESSQAILLPSRSAETPLETPRRESIRHPREGLTICRPRA